MASQVRQVGQALLLDQFGIDVVDPHPGAGLDAGMDQRLVERLVGIGQFDVLADHADAHLAVRVLEGVDQVRPSDERSAGRAAMPSLVQTIPSSPCAVQHRAGCVDRVGVPDGNDRIEHHVGEERDLGALVVGNRAVGAAQQHVGRDADLAQLLHAVLGGLGLEFAGGRNERHQREVHEAGAAGAHAQAHLPHRFEERQRLDVAHRAADLDDRHVDRRPAGAARPALDEVLDLVGDVRDHLHRLAEVLAAALLADAPSS